MQESNENEIWQASLDSSGRVLLPAELRHAMQVEPGSRLIWVKDEAGLHLRSFEDSLKAIQAYYQQLAPEYVVWSEELIKRRREEAEHE